jgi:hypothetical protein
MRPKSRELLTWSGIFVRSASQVASLCLAIAGVGLLHGVVQIVFVALGVVGVLAYVIWTENEIRISASEAHYNECKSRIEGTLETARRFLLAHGSHDVRANLMMFIRRDGKCSWGGQDSKDVLGLRMRFQTEGYDDQETMNVWPRSRGCVGKAWETGKNTLGMRSLEDPKPNVNNIDVQLVQLHHLRNVQQDVSTVLSLPLRDSKHGNMVIGIINFDDKKLANSSSLGTPTVVDAMIKVASDLSEIMADFKATLLHSRLWPPESSSAASEKLEFHLVQTDDR